MLRFQIAQSLKGGEAPLLPESFGPSSFLFETCLRKIWVSPENSNSPCEDASPYQFLLEVICGLHSPIFGETEILGQFRQFIEHHQDHPEFSYFLGWSQALLSDAKLLRTQFLTGHAQNSYGSLLRKKLSLQNHLHVIGAGNLVSSLIPWLSKFSITLWARDTEKGRLEFPNHRVEDLRHFSARKEDLVLICAPLQDAQIEELVLKAGCDWVDLREGTIVQTTPPPLLTLQDLFNEVKASQDGNALLRREIELEIQKIATERWNRAWFRPQGWEDVCAS